MFEGVLEKILQEKLGKYLEGFDKQNLNVGVRVSFYSTFLSSGVGISCLKI